MRPEIMPPHCRKCPHIDVTGKPKLPPHERTSLAGTAIFLILIFLFVSIGVATIFPPPSAEPIHSGPVVPSIPEGHLVAPTQPFLITAVTNATQTTTLIYITWSSSGGYQLSGMFTKNTLPTNLKNLSIYKMSDIEPGPLANKLDQLLEDIIWTP